MSITLADHILQNRELFLIQESDIIKDRVYTFYYKYDDEGIATIKLEIYHKISGTNHTTPNGTLYINFYLQCNSDVCKDESISSFSASLWYPEYPIRVFSEVYEDEKYGTCITFKYKYGDNESSKGLASTTKKTLDDHFKNHIISPSRPSVCPNCGKPHNPNGDCENDNCEENPNITPPSNPNDSPPVIWGYASEEIGDVEGYAGYTTPVFFRAWDDYGIYRFAYCEIDEHETEGLQIIRDFKPEKISDIGYRFNIFKELEGTYKYQIFVYDTAKQKTESNIFNVTINPATTKPVEPPIPPQVSDSEHIILYDKKANDFTTNGIGILDNDVIDCIVDKEENGIYELTLKYLITGKYVENLLDVESIIKCKTDISSNMAQLFRIYDSQYIMKDNIVIIKAQHISYDLKEALVENVNMVNITCKQATQALISRSIGNDKFVVDSNVETRANFSQQRVNVLESIVGLENSIFDTFSENDLVIERDNFHYNINKKVDNDKGVVIAYSKNLLGFKRTINSNNIITGIYPFAHLRNGAILKLKEKVIYSKYKDNYATPRIKAIDFTKETVVNEETLRSEASKYFENGCDIPRLNYEVDFISLYSNNILLKDKFRALEEIILGDTVTIQDSKIGINVKARVIKTVYNVLKKRYEKVELGNFKNEYRSSKKNEQNNLKKIVRSVMD